MKMAPPPSRAPRPSRRQVSLARALSKLGLCSRSRAADWIGGGRVRVNGRLARSPDIWVDLQRDRIEVDGAPAVPREKVYLMLNKPRGLITTASDEQGRSTVFDCLQGADLPPVSPVGRLDQASEGLLLFTNDTQWANELLAPATHVPKVYHVQVRGRLDADLVARLKQGVVCGPEKLSVSRAEVLREAEKNCWLEIVLTEGKNRQIRRLLEALGFEVMRLVRVGIGSLALGDLPKGRWRLLTREEVHNLRGNIAPSMPGHDKAFPRSPSL